MTFLRTDYSFSTQSIVHAYDQGLQFIGDFVAAKMFGSRLKTVTDLFQQLPQHVTGHNVDSVQRTIEHIVYELRTSNVALNDPAFDSELAAIENSMHTGVHVAPTKVDTVISIVQKLYALSRRLVGKPPAPLSAEEAQQQRQQRLDNVTAAFNRVKHQIASLTDGQKARLDWQPHSGEKDGNYHPAHPMNQAQGHMQVNNFINLAKFEVNAQLFNLATINAIFAISLGFFGLIGLKTLVLTVGACYAVRQITDRAMSLTNYESWKVPVVVPIPAPIPYLNAFFFPVGTAHIPTLKGAKQIFWKVINYGSSVGWTKMFNGSLGPEGTTDHLDTDINPRTWDGWQKIRDNKNATTRIFWRAANYCSAMIGRPLNHPLPPDVALSIVDPRTWDGWQKIWQNGKVVLGDNWRPNFLTIGNVIVFKNGNIALDVIFKQGIKLLFPKEEQQRRHRRH